MGSQGGSHWILGGTHGIPWGKPWYARQGEDPCAWGGTHGHGIPPILVGSCHPRCWLQEGRLWPLVSAATWYVNIMRPANRTLASDMPLALALLHRT